MIIKLDLSNVYSSVFLGFGTSLSWFANAIDVEKYHNEVENISDILFNKNNSNGLQMNIVRYNIGAGGHSSEFQTMRDGGFFSGYTCDKKYWDSNDVNQRTFLKKSKIHGAEVFEAFINSPPASCTVSKHVQGAYPWYKKIGFSNNLDHKYIKKFAEHSVKVLDFLINEDKIPFSSISPMNEPSSPGWVIGSSQEGCFYGFNGIRTKTLKSFRKALNSKDYYDVKVSGMEENNMIQAVIGIILNPFSLYNIDKLNVHRYILDDKTLGFNTRGLEDSNFFRKTLRYLMGDKQIWMSEYGLGFTKDITDYNDFNNVVNLAKAIIDDLNYLRPTAWVYWQAIENLSGNGWGLMQIDYNNPQNIVKGAQYRAFQHFSHFIKPGDRLIKMKSYKNVKITGSVSPDNVYKLVVLSTASEMIKLDMTFYNVTIMESTKTNYYDVRHLDVIHDINIKPNSLISIRFNHQ